MDTPPLPTLFPDAEPAPIPPAEGPFARVAIERSLDKVLTYSIPNRFAATLRVAQRVKVPLGRRNKPATGYVVAITQTAHTERQLKNILSIEDQRILLPGALIDLARWIARYYCCPLGTVIDGIIPSAVKKKTGLGYTSMVRLAKSRQDLQSLLERTRTTKRRAVIARLLQMRDDEAVDLLRIASDAGVKIPTVRKLTKSALITITPEPDFITNTPNPSPSPGNPGEGRGGGASNPLEPPLQLNSDQQKVLDDLLPRIRSSGFSVNLLHGVTGSGKTECYIRCIEEVVRRGKQGIVLVPEIALTPQTVRRFTARFARVAVLHSGLAASARHKFWQQISAGQADVVVGARSAIFAPLPNPGIIVVDEEHEGSFKQDNAPRYHARDVAIKRAQLESIPVILGSATPSLESYHRATSLREFSGVRGQGSAEEAERGAGLTPDPPPLKTYHLLTLPRRVRNLQLPHVELIDMKQELRIRREGIHLISRRLEHLLRTTLESGKQAILLLNRRGYANFIYCPSCTHLLQCKYCDVTLTYHRSAGAKARGAKYSEGVHTGQLHCHYCLAVNPLPEKCPACGHLMSLFGLGTQRVEEELRRKFPDLPYARVDSDTMHSARDYESILGQFARGEIKVLLGTQMIAKGLDYPNVTLVGVISGDTALALPDFRSAERTFQLITQVAGRAGRGDSPGRVILQTFLPDDPTIQAAIQQDFTRFAAGELKHRIEVGLPPVTRMVRIILRDEDAQKLQDRSEKLAGMLRQALVVSGQWLVVSGQQGGGGQGRGGSSASPDHYPLTTDHSAVIIKGPMPCAINRISGYHRMQILLFSRSAARLQQLLAHAREAGAFKDSDRTAVDVDPVSLL